MKTFYPFITSSDYLHEPLITLGLDINKDCLGQQVKRMFFLIQNLPEKNDLPIKGFVLASIENFLGRGLIMISVEKNTLLQVRDKVTTIQIVYTRNVKSSN